ncbi:serine-arginine protein 55-like [Bradysia coprophila]|uniref:serine-arginine protein 55-like n=1 Tax=Bradysia coprophila TaxID=38358 RepID=UPI00187DA32E|nr:serine-arginine protein 55-like [Bradysia coprophila]
MNRSRVYVGGLPYGVRERDLERFFKGYGRTREIFIKNGYAFVEFENYRDADDAVYELNGKKLLGERVRVEPTRGLPRSNRRYDGDRYEGRGRGGGGGRYGNDNRSSSRYYGPAFSTEFRVIVKNLSSRVDWKDLKDYMRQVGEVTYADAHKQRRNEGIVEFASVSDMKKAIEKLDDTELSGRRIQLIEDYHGGRSGGASRGAGRHSRSRSSSRSKSRSRSNQRGGNRSKSKSPAASRSKSRSRSNPRGGRSRSRSNQRNNPFKSTSKSRSRSKSRSSRSRSRSAVSRSRSKSESRSRSRDHSTSKSKRRESKSVSPKNNGDSPSRHESMED